MQRDVCVSPDTGRRRERQEASGVGRQGVQLYDICGLEEKLDTKIYKRSIGMLLTRP